MSTPADPETAQDKKPTDVTVHVNTKPVELRSHKVIGDEIKQAAIDQGVEIELDFELVEESRDGNPERKIRDDEEITVNDQSAFLAKPRVITIYVNSEPKEVTKKVLTYDDVVFLEWGNEPPTGENVQISITFKKAKEPHEGSLKPGGSVEIKEGTRFSVRASDKS